jgi:hypothetical protein
MWWKSPVILPQYAATKALLRLYSGPIKALFTFSGAVALLLENTTALNSSSERVPTVTGYTNRSYGDTDHTTVYLTLTSYSKLVSDKNVDESISV